MSSGPYLFDFQLVAPLDLFDLKIEYSGSERVVGIFGVSGAGKTTLLECLAGMKPVKGGRIVIAGQTWLDSDASIVLKAKNRRVGYVPQDHLLFPHRNVRGNLQAGKARAIECGLDFNEVFENVVSVLELEPLLDRKVDQLSGGERQRVSLGRALCSGPQLLLLDEPLASLDASLRRKILPYLIRAKEAFNLPMVIVSHNPIELQALCDEVMVLEKGRIVSVGDPNRIFAGESIFKIAKDHGFENVFSGTIIEKSAHSDRLRLLGTDDSCSIQIPATDSAVGDRLFASLGSDNILIGVVEPLGLSARNCIRAIIERIEDTGSCLLVHAIVSNELPNFIIELTPDAAIALSLDAGKDVYLVFKTSSVSTLSD